MRRELTYRRSVLAGARERGRATNLPIDITSFVDRRDELAEIKNLLSGARLVTLTGPGGIGKTRLALRVAASLKRSFRDGVWLIDLATLDKGSLIAETVASTVGIRHQSAETSFEMLAERMADQHVLLVLDNCERLVDGVARLAATLLSSAPKLSILATSRESLHVDGEHVLTVPPLYVPDPEQLAAEEALPSYHAVELFAERATAVVPNFAVDTGNVQTIIRICQRLDGLPLAIELAAVKLRALSADQILERLDHRLQFLAVDRHAAAPARQQTLRALMDWSFDLCSPEERELWARLSVFSGGLDLDAAENVCTADGIPSYAIAGLVMQLVDKSVLVPEEQGPRVWYRLPEIIREYGKERLGEPQREKVLRRHRDYYLKLAEQAETEWFGPHQVEWWSRLHRELPNFRTALEFSRTRPGEQQAGLRTAAALRIYWISTGILSEGRRWLDQLLDLATEPSDARAKALWVKCWLACLQSDVATAVPLLEESRGLAFRLDDAVGLAYTARLAGLIAIFRGDLPEATARFEEALERHRATDDPIGIVHALSRLASIAIFQGDFERAVSLCEESLAISDFHGERWYRSYTLWILGIAQWQKGHTAVATVTERDGLRLKSLFTDMLGTGNCTEALAWIAATEGNWKRSATLLGAVQRIWQVTGLSLYAYLGGFHSACVTDARKHLGDTRYERAFQHGQRFSPDQTIAYALGEQASTVTTPTRAQRRERSQLTRREEQVAELVARGLSNKDIAAQLVISRRTAEAHLEHILKKLGFTSRAQIAGWLMQTRNGNT